MQSSKPAGPLAAVALCLLLTACTLSSGRPQAGTPQPPRDTEAAMQHPDDPTEAPAGAGTERSDRIVEVRLGPHAIRLPANYLDGQRGMDFQGNFSLVLRWPDLGPYPPGVEFRDDPGDFLNAITVLPYYVDRVPVETLLDKWVTPQSYEDKDDPSESLALRIHGEPLYGLDPYYVDMQALAAYSLARHGEVLHGYRDPNANEDWYLRRDPSGMLVTVIKCKPRSEPDGVLMERGRLVDDPAVRLRALCDHSFIMPEIKTQVSMNYPRVLLPHWQRIEERARTLLRDGAPSSDRGIRQ